MDPDRDVMPEHQCPNCHDRSPYPVRCDRCDRQMTVAGVEEPFCDATVAERRWRLVAQMIGVGSTWSLCATLLQERRSVLENLLPRPLAVAVGWVLWRSILVAGPWLLAVVMTLLGLWLGTLAARAKIREARRTRRRSHGLAAMAKVPLVELSHLGSGPVRVQATIEEASPVLSDRGLSCAACEALDDGGGSPKPRHPQGSRFTVRDARGREVAVDGRCVQVVEGYDFDEETHVPVGARVELVAMGRVRADDGVGVGYRDHGRRVELVGSPGAPVLLRVLGLPQG